MTRRFGRPPGGTASRAAPVATFIATLVVGLAISGAVAAAAPHGGGWGAPGDGRGTPEASTATNSAPPVAVPPIAIPPATDPSTRNGREIYRRFREGLDDPNCDGEDLSARWTRHFAAAPRRLARRDDTLALFGYVVDALREASLPTEFALIPFIETGYKPGARSPLGAAGLWQMIEVTARDHNVPIGKGYDGRLSPVDSTRAAVRYLKTLHGMFAGDWRLAAMAYNAGEYRILRALKRGDQVARDAQPAKLPGLAPITHAYVRKLHALSCLMLQTAAPDDQRDAWLEALDRPVPRLEAVMLPADVDRIAQWASRHDQDAERLRRLNPVYGNGRIRHPGDDPVPLLAPALPPTGDVASRPAATDAKTAAAVARTHVVARGDTLSALAEDYGVPLESLLRRNDLTRDSLIQPGMVLQVDLAPSAHR